MACNLGSSSSTFCAVSMNSILTGRWTARSTRLVVCILMISTKSSNATRHGCTRYAMEKKKIQNSCIGQHSRGIAGPRLRKCRPSYPALVSAHFPPLVRVLFDPIKIRRHDPVVRRLHEFYVLVPVGFQVPAPIRFHGIALPAITPPHTATNPTITLSAT